MVWLVGSPNCRETSEMEYICRTGVLSNMTMANRAIWTSHCWPRPNRLLERGWVYGLILMHILWLIDYKMSHTGGLLGMDTENLPARPAV